MDNLSSSGTVGPKKYECQQPGCGAIWQEQRCGAIVQTTNCRCFGLHMSRNVKRAVLAHGVLKEITDDPR